MLFRRRCPAIVPRGGALVERGVDGFSVCNLGPPSRDVEEGERDRRLLVPEFDVGRSGNDGQALAEGAAPV